MPVDSPARFARRAALLALLLLALSLATPAARAAGPARPAAQAGGDPVIQIAGGQAHTCALTRGGRVWCWGGNNAGQLGSGSLEPEIQTTPLLVAGLSDVTAIAAGDAYTCAVAGGEVYCWGDNLFGQLGVQTEEDYSPVPLRVPAPTRVSALAAGLWHTCALAGAGEVWCWGTNDLGQLGRGTLSPREAPGPVEGLPDPARLLVAGSGHSCAATNTEVYCWGDNWLRQLGRGTAEPVAERAHPELAPVIALDGPVTALAAGGNTTCAADRSGLACWGNGPIGSERLGESPTPQRVGGLGGEPAALAVGEQHACAQLRDGRVFCWGLNSDGQIGSGGDASQPVPVEVPELRDARVIGSGNYHLCVVDAAGRVACRGRNDWGQLGNGTFVLPGGTPAGGYRPPGPLVPDLSTHIPTPLEVSTDPAVIGANLVLAALATLAFVAAGELLNQLLAGQEAALQRWLAPARWVARGLERLEARLGQRLISRPGLIDALKLAAVLAIYGLVFSFLDPTWNPLSLPGLWLFLSLALAAGLAGILDDLAQWLAARRRGLATRLDVRPANLLLAVGSTVLSRGLTLVPGIILGMPEAFDIEQEGLDARTRRGLLGVSAAVLLAVTLGAWALTAGTTALQRAGLPDAVAILVAGLESALLIVFAVSLQSVFLQMLGLPGSFGRLLLERGRLLWAAGLLAVSFALYHTLINPQGDLAAALEKTSIQAFVATIAVFLLLTGVVWLLLRRRAAVQPGADHR